MNPTLSVRNLRVEIPTRHGVLVAIDDLSFDIAPGEVLGMVGESGDLTKSRDILDYLDATYAL